MTIEDFGFRSYGGPRLGSFPRIFAIASMDVRRFFRRKLFLIFFLACVFPAIMTLVFVYIRFVVIEGQGEIAGMGDVRALRGPGARLFANLTDVATTFFQPFLSFAMPLAVAYSAVVGAGSISTDRRSGALELYFTRGIRPSHYFCGKWAAVTFMICCQILFSYLAVWVIAVFLAPDWGFLEETAGFVPRWILAQGFFCTSLGFLVTALSGTTSSPRFAIMRWFGILVFLYALTRVLYRQLGESWFFIFSPWHDLRRVAEAIAGVEGVRGFDPYLALLGTALLFALGFHLCRKSMRPVEVVG